MVRLLDTTTWRLEALGEAFNVPHTAIALPFPLLVKTTIPLPPCSKGAIPSFFA